LERVDAGVDAARLVARLPAQQREVLILRYFHDLTEEETAAILECPKGTVKSRMHQALARLAAYVREER
jgi:RNA polymerase sigma-70 factor (ECF subfamily)